MFSVRNQDGLFSARTDVCPHCLCDNKWHTVTAELIKNVATVRVDGRKLRVGVSKGYEQSLNTDHELYIGGFPGKMPSIRAILCDCLCLYSYNLEQE